MSTGLVETEVINDGPLAQAVRDAAIEIDENVVEEAFIVGDNEDDYTSSEEIATLMLRQSMRGFDAGKLHQETDNSALLDVTKSAFDGSAQSTAELGSSDLASIDVVEPPYPPELLATFLEIDESNYRCVKTKVSDAIGRAYVLEPKRSVHVDSSTLTEDDLEETVDQKDVSDEVARIETFIECCNEILGFEGVLERAGMDYEGIGWAAIEVIRDREMIVRKIAHIPASRVRVLRGWRGFVELIDTTRNVFYQPFGEKVVSKIRKNPFTNKPEPFDPELDGELGLATADWNLVDRTDGTSTSSFTNSANEIIWIPKHHSNTIYYGYSDVIPALGHILNNVHIRDYLLQFFEHNTIPRYAIIIEGAKLAPTVKDTIMKYFSTHVKGRAHKTLIIPIPSLKGEVKLRFEKLSADEQEGSFQETRKNNASCIQVAHGVSPAIIGIAEHSELGSGKGLSQAEIYKDRVVTPTQRRWARILNRLFVLGLGIKSISLKFIPLDIRDRHNEMEILTGYQEKGTLSVDEVRKQAQLGGPVPGGNRPFVMVQGAPIFVDEMSEQMSQHILDLETETDQLRLKAATKPPVQIPGKPQVPGKPSASGKPQVSNKPPASGKSQVSGKELKSKV